MGDDKHRSGLETNDYHRLTGFEGDWRDSWWRQGFLVSMAQDWGLGEAKAVLDVGCGVGHWGQRIIALCHAEASLIGLDAEAQWMDEARQRAKARGIDAAYQVANAETLPFDDASFDLVTCQTVLMHVADPAAVIAEMVRVLRPGGRLLAAEPNNFGSSAARTRQRPHIPWSEAVQLLELEQMCFTGKKALGEGDSSIGEILPWYFSQAGLTQIQGRVNDNMNTRTPPYDTPSQQQDIGQLRMWAREGAVQFAGCTFENGLRWFEAAGGTKERFTVLFELAKATDRALVEAIDANEHASAGGHLHYLMTGIKP